MRAVLTYHSIDASGSPISVAPATFRRHVEWLASGAVQVVPLTHLLRLSPKANAVALTFDDGFENFAVEAAPLLRAHGFPATLFVVSDRVGTTNAWGTNGTAGIPRLPLLDWASLARLAETGITLGAHGRTHRALDGLSDADVEDELSSCVEAIRERTGHTPETFAYPYGCTSSIAVAAARAHFTVSCTTELRPLRAGEDPARVPRLDAYYLQAPGRLEQWGSGELARYLWVRSQMRRVRHSLQTVSARL